MLPTVFSLPAGAIVGGRYKLLKSIGQGGFGITYIGWDSDLKRQVAVKECFPSALCIRDQESGCIVPIRSEWEQAYLRSLEDMRHEAQTLASLNHECVVRVHDVIWGNGSVFCVMPWLSGGTLRDKIIIGDMSAKASMQCLRHLLDALAYLHGRGVIHRDIKPENIMLDESGKPVIIDFGAALNRPDRTTGVVTTQGSFSYGYAAPEQITGKGKIGPWTDFYALSATWYELLTGVRPEAADARLMQDDLKPLESMPLRVSYPPELLKTLWRNMALLPQDRCESVAQWLECWEKGVLPPLSLPRHGSILKRRIAMGVGAALLLGGVVCAGWWLRSRPAQPVATQPSQPQVDPNSLRETLLQKVRATFKVEEYIGICKETLDKLDQMEAKWKKEYDKLTEESREKLKRTNDPERLNEMSRELRTAYQALNKRCRNEFDAYMKAFQVRIRRYSVDSADVLREYRAKDTNEAAVLPMVAEDIFAETSPWYSKVITKQATIHSSTSAPESEIVKLMVAFVEKANEIGAEQAEERARKEREEWEQES